MKNILKLFIKPKTKQEKILKKFNGKIIVGPRGGVRAKFKTKSDKKNYYKYLSNDDNKIISMIINKK